MLYVLDASALLNSRFVFDEKHRYASTYDVYLEFKSTEAKLMVENALKHKLLRIYRPRHKYLKNAKKLVERYGFKKMSKADISLLALAMQFKAENREFKVITDDYAIQNFLKLLNIEFESIVQGNIARILYYRYFCPACGYEAKKEERICKVCGSKIAVEKKFIEEVSR